MLNSQNSPPASENATPNQAIARKEVLKFAETPNFLRAEMAPTTADAMKVARAAAAMVATVEKALTMKVQQLPTREQKAKKPMMSSRTVMAAATM